MMLPQKRIPRRPHPIPYLVMTTKTWTGSLSAHAIVCVLLCCCCCVSIVAVVVVVVCVLVLSTQLFFTFIKKTFFGVLCSKNMSVKKGVKCGECGGLRKDLLLGELVKEGCVKEKGEEVRVSCCIEVKGSASGKQVEAVGGRLMGQVENHVLEGFVWLVAERGGG